MAEITVRVLDGSDWSLYRDIRLRALKESPASFSAKLADEADEDEQFWRERMDRSHQLLAERGGCPQGIASLGPYATEPAAGEIFGLYVVPEARSTGVSWRLVEAAATLASHEGHRQLYYWVGIDNGRAIGFAKNFGFRSTGSRRPSRIADLALGDYETALVLSLVPDETSVPNPTSDEPALRHGPVG